jgi:hypothetical protein
MKDITDNFIIAGRPGDREKRTVVVRSKMGPRSKAKVIERIRSKVDREGRLNYGIPDVEQAAIWSISSRVSKEIAQQEYVPWKSIGAFLLFVHGRAVKLDVVQMAVLPDHALVTEIRRMLFNFDHRFLVFRPRFKTPYRIRKRQRRE